MKQVAEFTDKYGKHFIVVESNGIRFVQEVTIGKTYERHESSAGRDRVEDSRKAS